MKNHKEILFGMCFFQIQPLLKMMQSIGADHGDKSVTQVWRPKAAVTIRILLCGSLRHMPLFCILLASDNLKDDVVSAASS